MPDMNETIRLALEMTGTSTVQDAIKAIEDLGKAQNQTSEQISKATQLLRYYEEIQKGANEVEDEAIRAKNLETIAQANLNRMLDEGAAEQQALATVTTSTAEAHKGLGRGVLQTSYAFQDFTSVIQGGGGFARAIGSVQNNIPVLLADLGVGAGLAGTISLVTVGLGAAIPLLMQFAGAEKEASEETKKLADEVQRLKNLQTGEQQESKGRVEQFLKEQPASVVAQGIRQSLEMEQRAKIAPNIGEAQVQDILMMTSKAREAEANRIFGGLETDPSARARAIGMAQARPGQFPKGFAGGLAGTEPDAFAASEQAADQEMIEAEAFGQRAHDAGVKRRENAKKAREDQEKRKKLVEHKQKVEDESIIQAADERERAREEGDELAADAVRMGEEQAAKNKREADAAAKAAARKADPTNQLKARADAQRDAITAQVLAADRANVQQGGQAASPAFLQEVTHQAIQNVNMGQMIGAAIQNAVNQTQAKIMDDMMKHMNGFNPTLLNR